MVSGQPIVISLQGERRFCQITSNNKYASENKEKEGKPSLLDHRLGKSNAMVIVSTIVLTIDK